MTRERAKELAPIIAAYAGGKVIQFKHKAKEKWVEVLNPVFLDDFDYRIKPTPTTRPMTRGEVLYMVTTTPAMVVKENENRTSIFPAAGYGGPARIDEMIYAIIDRYGNPIDGWHKFETTEPIPDDAV